MSMEPTTGMNFATILDEENQMFLVHFLSRFLCYGCKESLWSTTLTQCANGHGICSACTSKHKKKCPGPNCKKSVLFPMDLLTKKVVTCFPVVCKERYCCTLTFQPSVHEKQCSLATTMCKLCYAHLARKDLINHIMRYHPNNRIFKERNGGISWEDLHPTDLVGSSSYWPVYVDEYFFWIEIADTPNEKLISVKYSYVPTGRTDLKFLMNFFLKGPTKAFMEYSYLTMDSYLNDEDTSHQFGIHFSTLQSIISGVHEIQVNVTKILEDEI